MQYINDELNFYFKLSYFTLLGSSSSRDHLTYLSSLLKYSLGPPKYKSLITQLMERILDPSKPDLQPDVTHVSTGLMDLLKSGFSMFKKVTIVFLFYNVVLL